MFWTHQFDRRRVHAAKHLEQNCYISRIQGSLGQHGTESLAGSRVGCRCTKRKGYLTGIVTSAIKTPFIAPFLLLKLIHKTLISQLITFTWSVWPHQMTTLPLMCRLLHLLADPADSWTSLFLLSEDGHHRLGKEVGVLAVTHHFLLERVGRSSSETITYSTLKKVAHWDKRIYILQIFKGWQNRQAK